MLGDGVNKLGSMGSRVIVGRNVGVNVGTRVFVGVGGGVPVPVKGVAEPSAVLITNKSGVLVAGSVGNEKGVAVGAGGFTAAGVCKKGREIGSPLQPARRETNTKKIKNRFMRPLQSMSHAVMRGRPPTVLGHNKATVVKAPIAAASLVRDSL